MRSNLEKWQMVLCETKFERKHWPFPRDLLVEMLIIIFSLYQLYAYYYYADVITCFIGITHLVLMHNFPKN